MCGRHRTCLKLVTFSGFSRRSGLVGLNHAKARFLLCAGLEITMANLFRIRSRELSTPMIIRSRVTFVFAASEMVEMAANC